MIQEISFSLYQRFCLLESKVWASTKHCFVRSARKQSIALNEAQGMKTTAFPFFEARNFNQW